MMEQRLPMATAAEIDAFTKWRRVVRWTPGALRAVKKGYRRRARRFQKQEIQDQLDECNFCTD